MATAKTNAKRKPAKARARKATPKKTVEVEVLPEPDRGPEQINQDYDPAWHATVEAYVTLRDAGAVIPDAIRIPVESWLKDQEEKFRVEQAQNAESAAKRQKADEKGPKWIRSAVSSEFVLRLERQEDKRRRIELKPRGQRGDLFPLEPGDETDQGVVSSVQAGYIQLIGQTEAEEIVAHQTTNIQRVHSPLAVLTNEKGERPEGGFKIQVEQEHGKQGVVVGVIKPEQSQKRGLGEIYRPEQVQRFFPTGGNPAIVSSGFEPKLSEDAKASIADDLARRKGVQGRPEDVLNLGVTVEPTQRT